MLFQSLRAVASWKWLWCWLSAIHVPQNRMPAAWRGGDAGDWPPQARFAGWHLERSCSSCRVNIFDSVMPASTAGGVLRGSPAILLCKRKPPLQRCQVAGRLRQMTAGLRMNSMLPQTTGICRTRFEIQWLGAHSMGLVQQQGVLHKLAARRHHPLPVCRSRGSHADPWSLSLRKHHLLWRG